MVSELFSNSKLTFEVPADGSCRPPKSDKNPRRVLHFSDGDLEEYSTDEESNVEPESVQHKVSHLSSVDPNSLDWAPWVLYQTSLAGSKTLEVCDYLGESLASFFGITTPKYQYEIDHFKQMKEEEESLKQEQDLEMGGWVKNSTLTDASEDLSTTQPTIQK